MMETLENIDPIQIGIMSKLSTGSAFTDTLLCMVLPALTGFFTGRVEKIKQWLVGLLVGPSQTECSRTITYRVPSETSVPDAGDMRNKVLQDALLLYMGSIPGLVSKFRAAELEIIKRSGEEDDEGEKGEECDDSEIFYSDNDDEDEDEFQDLQIQIVPAQGAKVQVAPGIFFQKTTLPPNKGNNRVDSIITFHLTSNFADGQEKIEELCEKALEYYKTTRAVAMANSRYIYTPQSMEEEIAQEAQLRSILQGGNPNPQGPVHKRYKLSEAKAFDSFFHPEKEQLMHLLDSFTNKTGKFSITGYPQKLNLLLHGPPGTGKTSLIKAIGNYTQRNIVYIPLRTISTNQQLMDLVFDHKYYIEGEDWICDLPFEETIFFMEDVDVVAGVGYTRDNKVRETMKGSLSEQCKAGWGTRVVQDAKWRSTNLLVSEQAHIIPKWGSGCNKLNLAGILNVLDGVIDCPGRIVIMTTNHPEKLNPILMRPGRFNKIIYMGLLGFEEAVQMIQHHLGAVSEQERKDLESAFPVGKISPGVLESMCAECDSVRDILGALSCDA